MSDSDPTDADSDPTDAPRPLVRRAEQVDYDPVGAAEGMSKGVLVGPGDGAPNLAIRRFTLDAGAEVPPHTNEVEHEQYVLDGEYTDLRDAEAERGQGAFRRVIDEVGDGGRWTSYRTLYSDLTLYQ